MMFALLSICIMYGAAIFVELAALTAKSRLLTSQFCARISLLLAVIAAVLFLASKAGARNLADRHPRGAPIPSLDIDERHAAFCPKFLRRTEAGMFDISGRIPEYKIELQFA
jgi:hypothetical protein